MIVIGEPELLACSLPTRVRWVVPMMEMSPGDGSVGARIVPRPPKPRVARAALPNLLVGSASHPFRQSPSVANSELYGGGRLPVT